jgi:prolyl 4-hydroxylase
MQQPVSSGLAAACALDSAGRHGESFNTLKSAAAAGDLAATSELAHRLLVGDRAPKMPDHALSLLAGAARGGDGRALARMAALTAAGIHMPQSWTMALRLLGQAAAAGDASACGQLLSLQPAAARGNWVRTATQIDIEGWLAAAPVMALHPKIGRVPQLAPPSVCDWLMGRAHGHLVRARVYDSVSREELVHASRTNTVANFDLSTLDVVQILLQARMAATCGAFMQQLEVPMVLRYEVGQHNAAHFDFIDAGAVDHAQQICEQGQRMITFLLYLNDDYTAGETTFPKLGLVNRGRRGEGLYFVNSLADRSGDRQMLHTGSAPTSGEKWIVTQFIRDIRLRP